MASTNLFENEQAIAIAALVGVVIVLFIIKRLILVRLKAKARSEKSSMSDIYRVLVLSLNAPLNLLIWVIFPNGDIRISIFSQNGQRLRRVL